MYQSDRLNDLSWLADHSKWSSWNIINFLAPPLHIEVDQKICNLVTSSSKNIEYQWTQCEILALLVLNYTYSLKSMTKWHSISNKDQILEVYSIRLKFAPIWSKKNVLEFLDYCFTKFSYILSSIRIPNNLKKVKIKTPTK